MRNVVLLLVLVVFLVAPGVFALAQSDAPQPPAIPDELLKIPTPQEIILPAILSLIAMFTGVVSSPVTSTITAIVKRITPKLPDYGLLGRAKRAEASEVSLAVAVVLIGFSWLAAVLGLQGTFNGFISWIMMLTPVVVGTASSFKGQHDWYERVIKGMPGLGTSRKALPQIRAQS